MENLKKIIIENKLYYLNNYLKYSDNSKFINKIKNQINLIQDAANAVNVANADNTTILDNTANKIIDNDSINNNENIDYKNILKQVYRVKWSKLKTDYKYNRIYSYLKQNNYSKNNYNIIINLYKEKKITSKDIIYDDKYGSITNINNLKIYI